jgi:hypothetical protein
MCSGVKFQTLILLKYSVFKIVCHITPKQNTSNNRNDVLLTVNHSQEMLYFHISYYVCTCSLP